MSSSVIHLKRAGTNLTTCGEDGPFFVKTFNRELVTCNKCITRAGPRMNVPEPRRRPAGQVVQPGGGHRVK